jgi:hypothetical protein
VIPGTEWSAPIRRHAIGHDEAVATGFLDLQHRFEEPFASHIDRAGPFAIPEEADLHPAFEQFAASNE